MKAAVLSSVGLAASVLTCPPARAGEATQDLDFFIIVERFAEGGFGAEVQVETDPDLFAEIRLGIPGEPAVPFLTDGDGSYSLPLDPDGTFEAFLTDPADGKLLDLQLVDVNGPVTVYRFSAGEVFGPQVDLASIPGFATDLSVTPGMPGDEITPPTPTTITWTSPDTLGDFLVVFGEDDPLTIETEFGFSSPLQFDPPLLVDLEQIMTLTDDSTAIIPELEGVAFSASVEYGAVLGGFAPVLISGPKFVIGNAVGLAISVAEVSFVPAGCPADLAPPLGTLDLADIAVFVQAFLLQQPPADIDANGVYDLTDIAIFVTAFNSGCL